MAIGKRLKDLRDSKGLTQQQLNQLSGVSDRSIREIENGVTKNPSMATVKSLASALGVPPDQLVGHEPAERPAPRARHAGAGAKSAREAVANAEHYLQYLFKRAGLETEEAQQAAAAKLDERFRQWETVTPALVDLWLESYVRDLPSQRSPASSSKRGRGAGR